jgi:hypothetical protein
MKSNGKVAQASATASRWGHTESAFILLTSDI